jgi:hypothetical protein
MRRTAGEVTCLARTRSQSRNEQCTHGDGFDVEPVRWTDGSGVPQQRSEQHAGCGTQQRSAQHELPGCQPTPAGGGETCAVPACPGRRSLALQCGIPSDGSSVDRDTRIVGDLLDRAHASYDVGDLIAATQARPGRLEEPRASLGDMAVHAGGATAALTATWWDQWTRRSSFHVLPSVAELIAASASSIWRSTSAGRRLRVRAAPDRLCPPNRASAIVDR